MNAPPVDSPAVVPIETAPPRWAGPPIEPAVKTIGYVLISDHALLRHGLRETLHRKPTLRLEGEFDRGADALDACEALRPALAIVAGGGAERRPTDVVRKAAARRLGTKFIVILEDTGPSVVRDAFEAGVHGCLLRRAPYSMLDEAIRAVLAGRTYWCPESSRLLIEAMRTAAGRREALSARDRELILGVARSEPVKCIADRLGVSAKTATNRLTQLKSRLGVADGAGIVRYAIRTGLLDPSEC